MKAEFVRIYKAVHTWTGIVSGMALFIAFYAGALTVFKEPLERWVSPPESAAVLPLAAVQPLVRATLAAQPAAARDFSLRLQGDGQVLARVEWQVRDPQADDHDERSIRHYGATLDAHGALRVQARQPTPLGQFIDVLHRVVGLPTDSDPHRWVMGVVAVLYALALVSGVVVLLPSLVKDFFALRVGKNLKRMWLDAHNVVGIVSLPFHLVMALSAVVFAFHDQIYAVQDPLLHEGRWGRAFDRTPPKPGAVPPRDVSALLPPERLLQLAQAEAPGLQATVMQYQQVSGPRAVARVWGKDPAAVSPRARGGFVALDPYSGKVLGTDFLPGRQNTPNLFISSFFALHMASFSGVLVQWMYFLLGLAGAWLFYSGNLLWVETRRRKAARNEAAPPVQRWDAWLMACATVGICLGCVCGISLTIVGGRWLQGASMDMHAVHMALYYAAFFASVAWAFGRGPARAAVHLLWAAAVLTLGIPATTVALRLVQGTGPADGWGVDATALFGALAFALMARATARRLRTGPADSVWSAPPLGRSGGPVPQG